MRFKKAFKDFSKSMDIVMPDPIANPYRKHLKVLGKIYTATRNRYRDKNLNIKGVGDKVKRLINDHIRATDIRILNEPVSILNEEEFDKVIESTKTEEAKASEMEHAIRSEINVRIQENPVFYQSLSERLEEIINKKHQGRLDITEQIDKLGCIINDMRNVKTRAEKIGLNEKEFALYELLLSEREIDSSPGSSSGKSGTSTDDEFNINKKIKELTQKLMSELKEYAKIDLWKEKEQVLKDMRKIIKISLSKYDEFRSKYKSLTTKIMKLARNILVLL